MQRISELEENLKKVKEELEKKSQIAQADEEVSKIYFLNTVYLILKYSCIILKKYTALCMFFILYCKNISKR